MRTTTETAIGDERHVFAKSGAHDGAGGFQHLYGVSVTSP